MNDILILIQKYQWENDGEKRKNSNLTTKELIGKYDGFEGECFYHEEYSDIALLIKDIFVCKDLLVNKKDKGYEILCLANSSFQNAEFFKENFTFSGYDYGIVTDEDNLYSSIFQEILFGNEDELTKYYSKLNENLLFPNKKVAREYVELHHCLAEEGKNVEMEDYMEIYEVWKFK